MAKTIDDLFKELLLDTSHFSTSKDFVQLSFINKQMNRNIGSWRIEKLVKKFPEFITKRQLLLHNFSSEISLFALKPMSFKVAKHEYNCSWYQYALYTKDTNLQIHIENAIAKIPNKAMRDIGFAELKRQYLDFKNNGITFKIDKEVKHSKGVSLDALDKAYDLYLQRPRNHFLVHTIGKLQSLLPKHMILEVCHPNGFAPKPNGSSLNEVTNVSARVWVDGSDLDPPFSVSSPIYGENTDNVSVQLGSKHALVRGNKKDTTIPYATDEVRNEPENTIPQYYQRAWGDSAQRKRCFNVDAVRQDRLNFSKLDKIRTNELTMVMERIQTLENKVNDIENNNDHGLSPS